MYTQPDPKRTNIAYGSAGMSGVSGGPGSTVGLAGLSVPSRGGAWEKGTGGPNPNWQRGTSRPGDISSGPTVPLAQRENIRMINVRRSREGWHEDNYKMFVMTYSNKASDNLRRVQDGLISSSFLKDGPSDARNLKFIQRMVNNINIPLSEYVTCLGCPAQVNRFLAGAQKELFDAKQEYMSLREILDQYSMAGYFNRQVLDYNKELAQMFKKNGVFVSPVKQTGDCDVPMIWGGLEDAKLRSQQFFVLKPVAMPYDRTFQYQMRSSLSQPAVRVNFGGCNVQYGDGQENARPAAWIWQIVPWMTPNVRGGPDLNKDCGFTDPFSGEEITGMYWKVGYITECPVDSNIYLHSMRSFTSDSTLTEDQLRIMTSTIAAVSQPIVSVWTDASDYLPL